VFDSDAEWIEAPERVNAKTYRGHDGIRESFERWLAQWGEYRLEVERIEDHGDQVLAVVKEYAERPGERRLHQSHRGRGVHLPRVEGDSLPRVLRRDGGAGVDCLSRPLAGQPPRGSSAGRPKRGNRSGSEPVSVLAPTRPVNAVISHTRSRSSASTSSDAGL
jgi:SnoaL-like domain